MTIQLEFNFLTQIEYNKLNVVSLKLNVKSAANLKQNKNKFNINKKKR